MCIYYATTPQWPRPTAHVCRHNAVRWHAVGSRWQRPWSDSGPKALKMLNSSVSSQLLPTVMASVAMLSACREAAMWQICNKLQCRCIKLVPPIGVVLLQHYTPSTARLLHFCNTLPPTSRTWCSPAEFRNNKLFLQPRGTAGAGDMAKPLEPINCYHQNYLSSLLRLVGI